MRFLKNFVVYMAVIFITLVSCTLLDSNMDDQSTDTNQTTTNTQDTNDSETNVTYTNTNEFAITGSLYDIGSPTDEETYMLELINRARSAPGQEGEFLINTGNASIEQAVTYFAQQQGSDYTSATNQVYTAFQAYSISQPLAFNKDLNEAAVTTSQMMRDYDIQAHTINGTSPGDRITAAGYSWVSYGENIFANSKSTLYGHAGFNIDWGNGPNGIQDPPGHRYNIMDIDRDFREIGISILTNDIPDTNTTAQGPQLVSQEFGRQSGTTYYITGVVYDDTNANRFYDSGEGIGGVLVSVEGGTYYAVSAESGAYSIPFSSGMGAVRVQAGASNFQLQVVNVTLASENYKLDFNVQGTGANGDASIGFDNILPASSRRIETEFEKVIEEHGYPEYYTK